MRGFSSVYIFPDLLIDCPPDLSHQATKAGVELFRVRYIAVTHSHPDHLSTVPLLLRRSYSWASQHRSTFSETAQPLRPEPLTIYGNAMVLELVRAFLKGSPDDLKVHVEKLKPFEPERLDEQTLLHPLLAAHRLGKEECFVFILERSGQSLLYAADTGWLPEESWDYLRQFQLDAALVEATYGLLEATEEHLNLVLARKVRERLRAQGSLLEGAPFVLTHLSPHWTPPHHLLEPTVQAQGMMAGYDGMVVQV